MRDVDPSPPGGRGPGADCAGGAGCQPGRDDGDAVADRLDGLWADEDFAGWYPRDGRPGISPTQLATVTGCGSGVVAEGLGDDRGGRLEHELPERRGAGLGGGDAERAELLQERA